MRIVDKKPRQRSAAKRGLMPLTEATGPARYFNRCLREVQSDLGGKRALSRIEIELAKAFAGSSTLLQAKNVQLAIGEWSEVDLGAYTALVSALVRVASRLGLQRRQHEIPTLAAYLQSRREESDAANAEALDGANNPIDAAVD